MIYEEEVQPYRKTDYKPIIITVICIIISNLSFINLYDIICTLIVNTLRVKTNEIIIYIYGALWCGPRTASLPLPMYIVKRPLKDGLEWKLMLVLYRNCVHKFV